jgi:DNA-binding NtrC family response regulator
VAGVAPYPPATILVLEESAAVQDLIDQALRGSGHRVLTTKNALEALEVVRRVRIDVLILGVLEEQGEALITELRSTQAGLRVVSIGGPDDDLEGAERSISLSNPVSLDDLRDAVAAWLSSGGEL